MPTEISTALDALQRAVTAVPGALVVIVLLGGPTAVWIAYRAVMAAQRGRFGGDQEQPMWVCASCRSANTLRDDRCYRCGTDAGDVETLQFIGRDGVTTLGGAPTSSPGTAVGPGHGTVGSPVTASMLSDATRRVAVGPGKPTPRPPRKAVIVDRPKERSTTATRATRAAAKANEATIDAAAEPDRPLVRSRKR